MPAEWAETDAGFVVTLRTIEAGAEIFSLRLTAASKQQARRFCERWGANAPFLYQTIIERLGDPGDETHPEPEKA